ncbi:MAG: tetratricopeptide repeat protein [Anaerolineae bacterium]
MGKLYIPSKARTSLDHIRRDLDHAERSITHLDDSASEPLHLLHLFDRIENGLNDLVEEGVDVRVEKTRFEAMQRKLRHRQALLLNQAGRALEEEREKLVPARSHWWWFVDKMVARNRRRRWVRLAGAAATVFVLVIAAWQGYMQFPAPPPEMRKALRHKEAGQSEAVEGNLRAALSDMDVTTRLKPEDAEAWLWKGVLHEQLGEKAAANEAFAVARTLYNTGFDFVLDRGRVRLQTGDSERAKTDAQSAVAMDGASGWGYYLRASIAASEGNYDSALSDLQKAAELAREADDGRLQAIAGMQRAQLMKLQSVPSPD